MNQNNSHQIIDEISQLVDSLDNSTRMNILASIFSSYMLRATVEEGFTLESQFGRITACYMAGLKLLKECKNETK